MEHKPKIIIHRFFPIISLTSISFIAAGSYAKVLNAKLSDVTIKYSPNSSLLCSRQSFHNEMNYTHVLTYSLIEEPSIYMLYQRDAAIMRISNRRAKIFSGHFDLCANRLDEFSSGEFQQIPVVCSGRIEYSDFPMRGNFRVDIHHFRNRHQDIEDIQNYKYIF